MIHYKIVGNEPNRSWLVMIHGAGGSIETWYRQVPELSRHFNLLLVDLAGHGNSEISPDTSELSFEVMADQVIEVLDYLKIEKCHFMALSIGCIVSQVIADHYPQRIKKMVMAGAITAMTFRTKMIVYLTDRFKRVFPRSFITWMLVTAILPQKKSNRVWMKSAEQVSNKSFLLWLSVISKMEQLLAGLFNRKCQIPTLYLMGKRDILFLSSVKRIAKRNKEYAKLIVVPKAGHACNIDNKRFFNQASIEYLLA